MTGKSAQTEHSGAYIDIAAGLVLAGIAGFCLLWLIPQHTQAASTANDIAPGFFPTLASVVVLVLAVAMILNRLVGNPDLVAEIPGWRVLAEIGTWSSVSLIVILALPAIGFLPTAIALILAGGLAARHPQWWFVVLLAIVFPVIVKFGVWKIFTVELP